MVNKLNSLTAYAFAFSNIGRIKKDVPVSLLLKNKSLFKKMVV